MFSVHAEELFDIIHYPEIKHKILRAFLCTPLLYPTTTSICNTGILDSIFLRNL